MKTTKKDFELFKSECLNWQKKLGLTNYKFYFYHNKNGGKSHADVYTGILSDYHATFNFYEDWEDDGITDENIKRVAFHEVCHILLARLVTVAENRFVTEDEVDESAHEMIRRLEHIFFNQ